MAAYDGSIKIDTKIDASGAEKGGKAVDAALLLIEGHAAEAGAALAAAFAPIAVVTAIVIIIEKLVELGKKSVEVASDLSEVQNVVDTTFGAAAQSVNKFAGTALEKFGLSELAAKKFTSTMGAMLKSMGFTTERSADMSETLTGLAGDMASFYNLDPEEAFEKLRSGISGEVEPLKQLGINLSESNLSAYAMSKGINTAYSSMTEMQKAALRYQYILSVTSDAQGDYARTSDSWANQTRLLAQQWEEFIGILGKGLINTLLPIVQALNALLSKLIDIAKAITGVNDADLGSSLQDMGSYADSASKSQDDLATSIKNSSGEAKKALANFDDLNILQLGLAKNGAGTGGVGGSPGGGLDDALNKGSGSFNNFGGSALAAADDVNKLQAAFERVKATVTQPIMIPSPVVGALPDPVFDPQWGLDVPPIPVPEFPTIPEPIYSPNWGLLDTLAPELVSAKDAVDSALAPLPTPVYSPNWGLLDTLAPEVESVFATLGNVLVPLPAPVYSPNWGLLDTLAPEVQSAFTTLNNLLLPLPAPVFNPNWGIVNSFLPESAAFSSAFSEMLNGAKSGTAAAVDYIANEFSFLDFAIAQSTENSKTSVGDFSGAAQYDLRSLTNAGLAAISTLAVGMSRSTHDGSSSSLESIKAFCEKGYANFLSYAESSSAAHANLEKSRAESTWQAGKSDFGVFVGWLEKKWEAFSKFARATGQELARDVFHIENASVPQMSASTRVGIGLAGALSLYGGAAIPAAISSIPIPAFATGAVLPPNNPFLAIVGDQKSGTNVETPLSTMVEAFNQALDARGGENSGVLHIEMMVKTEPGFARNLSFELDEVSKNRGVSLVKTT